MGKKKEPLFIRRHHYESETVDHRIEEICNVHICKRIKWRKYKDFLQTKKKKNKQPNRKMGQTLKRALHVEDIQLINIQKDVSYL